ncbi:beta-lactamase family protein [Carboxylicivirga sp. A043]|uniref:serine hydrolase domain-containing protein n=1 Tax=Carboxylicivirga litoralis TaxID=2816963 RepID=UPI0021CAFC66|nr:serine hydrolase domain-containing protein [Carboxylicivirga sp. A043]MCU4156737.1 beta-lactamase family protein [Carboxylicivirga sp. A043]
MRTLLTSLTLIFLFVTASSQDSPKWERLNSYFKLLEDNNKFMGGIAIYKGENRLYEYYTGLSSVKEEKHANYQTRYRIGSVTKMFTATMIFQLIEEGRLTLDTKLSEFYPQITNSRKITISDLLNHRSGLHEYTSGEHFVDVKGKSWHKGELMSVIVNFPIDFEPGEKAKYSNTNYLLLGFIIERLTNESYSIQLNNSISKPYILTATQYGGTINTTMHEAQSYVYRNRQWEQIPQTDMSLARGAGAIIANARDLNVFAQLLFQQRIINEVSLDSLVAMNDGVGRGVFKYPYRNKYSLGHNGNVDGFQSHLSYFPDDSVSISVLGNGMNYPLNAILTTALDAYYEYDYELPEFSNRQVDMPIEILERIEGNYLSDEYPEVISLVLKEGQLYAQTAGHTAYPLTTFENGSFRFEPVGIELKFEGDKHSIVMGAFVLYQRGAAFNFVKQ